MFAFLPLNRGNFVLFQKILFTKCNEQMYTTTINICMYTYYYYYAMQGYSGPVIPMIWNFLLCMYTYIRIYIHIVSVEDIRISSIDILIFLYFCHLKDGTLSCSNKFYCSINLLNAIYLTVRSRFVENCVANCEGVNYAYKESLLAKFMFVQFLSTVQYPMFNFSECLLQSMTCNFLLLSCLCAWVFVLLANIF
eukprot:TRINITY_DN25056_c0_g1_i2.p2 TRINITY_DN25056_c0_g1~~TRINITY_DN25056_c0_g1_i2.p2  ORF type:complete len:194 (+),score=-16.64 TRINITY_DN25056_c0_g1_i2:404-985(+)